MFERFTDRARRVVVLAQEEARMLSHDYIGTEHLLLGLIHEQEGVAAQTLEALGLELNDIRAEVEQRVGRGTETPHGHMPFTPRCKKVLEMSLRQALKLDHDYLGTEHILLGLIDEAQGVGAQILLARVDGGLDRIQIDVLNRLVELGSIPKGERYQAEMRQRMSRASAGASRAASSMIRDDEVLKRLEAIEARLSVIERAIRDWREGRAEETG